MGENHIINKFILLILVLGVLTLSYADMTINYSIIEANWSNLTTPYNFSVNVWKDNTKNNPVVKETPYAKFIIWVEKYTNGYKILNNATTINGYKSIKYRAELFNASGEHPSGVGNNPANNQYGDETGITWYWEGVSESDFSSYQTTTKSPIPLGALIITLIVIPLLTLKIIKSKN